MKNLATVSAALTCRWNMRGILPSLPIPGTAQFGDLVKELAPHEIGVKGLSLLAPTANLSDVLLTLPLYGGRIQAKYAYDSIELATEDLSDDQENLVDISKILFRNLHRVDPNAVTERVVIHVRLHAQFQKPADLENFLESQLPYAGRKCDGRLESTGLIPDGASFNMLDKARIDTEDITVISRLNVAKSIIHDQALFIELYCQYSPPPPLCRLAEDLRSHVRSVLRNLDLNLVDLDLEMKGES